MGSRDRAVANTLLFFWYRQPVKVNNFELNIVDDVKLFMTSMENGMMNMFLSRNICGREIMLR